jgi:hypothetical protein
MWLRKKIMKSTIYNAGKGKGGLHLGGSKGNILLGTSKPPSNTKNRPDKAAKTFMGNKGPEIRLGKRNKGVSSLNGTT